MKTIHAHVYNPRAPSLFKAKSNDRAELHTVVCPVSDRCEVFARGQCIARMFLSTCKYGRACTEQGPTPKAKSFGEWVRTAKDRAAPVGTLDCATQKMARVGDHIWLPYAQMDLARTGKYALFTTADQFVLASEFTTDLVVKLCEARPTAMLGGEITSYQAESVPKFIGHLSEMWPDLLREAAERSPRIREVVTALTKVGRKARLSTLRPNVGTFSGGASPAVWTWDGEHLTCCDSRGFPPFTPFDAAEVRIRPGADAVVTITDDLQVTDSTVFCD